MPNQYISALLECSVSVAVKTLVSTRIFYATLLGKVSTLKLLHEVVPETDANSEHKRLNLYTRHDWHKRYCFFVVRHVGTSTAQHAQARHACNDARDARHVTTRHDTHSASAHLSTLWIQCQNNLLEGDLCTNIFYIHITPLFWFQTWFYQIRWFYQCRSLKHSKWWRHKLCHT